MRTAVQTLAAEETPKSRGKGTERPLLHRTYSGRLAGVPCPHKLSNKHKNFRFHGQNNFLEGNTNKKHRIQNATMQL